MAIFHTGSTVNYCQLIKWPNVNGELQKPLTSKLQQKRNTRNFQNPHFLFVLRVFFFFFSYWNDIFYVNCCRLNGTNEIKAVVNQKNIFFFCSCRDFSIYSLNDRKYSSKNKTYNYACGMWRKKQIFVTQINEKLCNYNFQVGMTKSSRSYILQQHTHIHIHWFACVFESLIKKMMTRWSKVVTVHHAYVVVLFVYNFVHFVHSKCCRCHLIRASWRIISFHIFLPGMCVRIYYVLNTKETENSWHVHTQNTIEIEMRHRNVNVYREMRVKRRWRKSRRTSRANENTNNNAIYMRSRN